MQSQPPSVQAGGKSDQPRVALGRAPGQGAGGGRRQAGRRTDGAHPTGGRPQTRGRGGEALKGEGRKSVLELWSGGRLLPTVGAPGAEQPGSRPPCPLSGDRPRSSACCKSRRGWSPADNLNSCSPRARGGFLPTRCGWGTGARAVGTVWGHSLGLSSRAVLALCDLEACTRTFRSMFVLLGPASQTRFLLLLSARKAPDGVRGKRWDLSRDP